MGTSQEKVKNSFDAIVSFLDSRSQLKRWINLRTSFNWHLSLDIFRFQGVFASAKRRLLFFSTLFFITILYIFYCVDMVYSYHEHITFQKDLNLKQTDVFINGELSRYEKYRKNNNFSVDCATLKAEKEKEDFVYVGVLTSERTINTLGRAVHNTWGKEADKMDFYVGNAPLTTCECDQCKTMPIVKLDVVSDQVYPPQAKSFRMLENICDKYIDKYKWFVRADDDGYVKFSNLRRLLHKLDENIPYYLGLPNPGYWHGYHYLKVWGQKYCDGSAVVFSRGALKSLCPHLRHCSENCLTHHEDVEVGRCVMNNLGLQCATSTGDLKMEELFYHQRSSKPIKFTGDPDKATYVKKAIHMHKVTEPAIMHNLHAYYLRAQEAMEEYCGLKKLYNNQPSKS